METQNQEVVESSRPVQLSKREIVVDLMGRLDAMFSELHNARDRMLNSAQNLRESRRLLDASVEGKSLDDAPDTVEDFLAAVKLMHENLEPLVEQMEQMEAITSHVLIGARSLDKPSEAQVDKALDAHLEHIDEQLAALDGFQKSSQEALASVGTPK